MSRRQLVKRIQEHIQGNDRWDLPYSLKWLLLDMAQEIEWLDQDNQRLHEKIDELRNELRSR